MHISIIIATYNAEKTLERCLNSIISQKNDQVELIVIDAQSKDSTVKIIEAFGSDIDYFISEKDKGIYDAWNKGIMASRGNWIMFIGADDILNKGSILVYMNFIYSKELNNVDYISANNLYVNKHGKLLKIMGEPAVWAKMRKRMVAGHVGSLHNRDLFRQVGVYDLQFKICADYELLLRKKGGLKIEFINEIIATMQAGGMSMSFAALKEVYSIRKHHQSLPSLVNFLYFLRDILAYYFFRLRKMV